MNVLARSVVAIVICGASHAVVSSRLQAQEQPDESLPAEPHSKQQVEFRADPTVDEQLFMIRRLEDFFTRWPSDFSDRGKATEAISNLRHELTLAHTYLQEKGCDKRLIAMYSDSIAMAERYGEFLADIGAINADFKRRIEGTGTLVEGVEAGAKAGVGLALAGVEPMTATLAIGGLMIKQGIATYEERNRLSQEQAAAIDRRLDKYLAERSRLIGHVEVQAEVLAEKHGWKAAEVGFDQDEEESARLADAVTSSDFQYLTEHLQELQAARPRDPFVFASTGILKETQARSVGTSNDKEASRLHREAKEQYLRAARLVPHGRFHESLRCDYFWKAARNASLRLYHEPQAKDEDAITISEAALRGQPRDPTGKLRFTKAFALARNGRAHEAVEVFKSCASALGDKASTHYDWACLLSLADRPDEALEHIEAAWGKGLRNVRNLREDRDLTNLRRKHGRWFGEHTTPQCDVRMDYGWAWNDAVATNTSGFPITRAIVVVTLKGIDGAESKEVYQVGHLADGQSRTVSGVFDGKRKNDEQPGARESQLFCDENAEVKTLSLDAITGVWSGYVTRMRADGGAVESSTGIQLMVLQDKGAPKVLAARGTDLPRNGLLDVGKIRLDALPRDAAVWEECALNANCLLTVASEKEVEHGIYMRFGGDEVVRGVRRKIATGVFQMPLDAKEGEVMVFVVSGPD